MKSPSKLPALTKPNFNIAIKSKIIVMLLSVGLGSILCIGYLAWSRSRSTLTNTVSRQLTSLRNTKASQITDYFDDAHSHVATLGEDRMVIDAMVEFNRAYKELNSAVIPEDWYEELEAYYEQEFFPKLQENITLSITPSFNAYRPASAAGTFLQFQYLVRSGEADSDFEDKLYAKIQAKYDSIFQNLTQNFGYRNLYLINYKTGDIVYATKQEVDLGTNLQNGPYYQSNLAKAFQSIQEKPDPGLVKISDFAPYRPALGLATAFIGAPIYNGPHQVGVLVIELDTEEISNIMTGGQDWENNGLGKTGQLYLVGDDGLMRSDSRSLLEDAEKYLQVASRNGLSKTRGELTQQLGTSVLLQNIDSQSFKEAIKGQAGTIRTQNYLNKEVLSSYNQLDIKGLNWAILAEMTTDEAYGPIDQLSIYLVISTAVIVIIVTLAGGYISGQFTIPIKVLIDSIHRVSKGEKDVTFKITSKDEIGELGKNLQEMITNVEQKTQLLEEKNDETESLLRCMMPEKIAHRLSQGEKNIAENIRQATVIFSTLIGFTTLSEQKNVHEAALLLNELIDRFDEAAKLRNLDKIRTLGKSYLAAAGVTSTSLDQTRQTVAFAHDLFTIIETFNREHRVSLGIKIGIETGPIRAGVIGTKKFMYEIWGKTVNIANHLNLHAAANTIFVSESVHQALQDFYEFEQGPESQFEDKELVKTWVIRPNILGATKED